MLAGVKQQPAWKGLDYRHFEETRDNHLSVDRLGDGCANAYVVNRLSPQAEAAGGRFRPPKPFNGWFNLRAQFLLRPPDGRPGFPITRDPMTAEDGQENPYHAYVGAALSLVRWLVVSDALGPVIVGICAGLVASRWPR